MYRIISTTAHQEMVFESHQTLSEIDDALARYTSPQEISHIQRCFSQFGTQDFSYSELENKPNMVTHVIRSDSHIAGFSFISTSSLTPGKGSLSILVFPDFSKRGLGKQLLIETLQIGFKKLNLNQINALVHDTNRLSFNFFQSFLKSQAKGVCVSLDSIRISNDYYRRGMSYWTFEFKPNSSPTELPAAPNFLTEKSTAV
ncbi:GNAT family N-acetyltransferase [bacterium]|jgi:RimJ/RimL family protein N-acetyltransferase|nr:GNAT family N-acetyltransferase [bacterium]